MGRRRFDGLTGLFAVLQARAVHVWRKRTAHEDGKAVVCFCVQLIVHEQLRASAR